MEKEIDFIYGVQALLEILKNDPDHRLRKIYISLSRKPDKRILEILNTARQRKIPIEKKEKSAIDKISGAVKNQGIIGVCDKKNLLTLKELLFDISKKKKKYPALLIADGILDPGNLGALIRSAHALGIDGVILPKRRSAGVNQTVYKASAGAANHIPLALVSNIAYAIDTLKKEGYWIAAVDMHGTEKITQTDLLIPLAVILGGEHTGIRRIIKEKSDFMVYIPMEGRVSSLNVSAAGAIVFYEAARQKRKALDS